jgi:hypothetical protein
VVGLASVWRGEKRLTKVLKLKSQTDCYTLKINECSRNLGRPEDVTIMRRRCWRSSLRRLMLLVALTSLAVGGVWGYRICRLYIDYADKARWCESLERSCWELEAIHRKNAEDDENLAAYVCALSSSNPELSNYFKERVEAAKLRAAQSREAAADCARKAARCASLARKYERAARRPWLPVEPDPPEP